MSSKDLSERDSSWNPIANEFSTKEEVAISKRMEKWLPSTGFEIIGHPSIPTDYFTAKKRKATRRFDIGIRHIDNNRIAYIESKLQGDEGNAVERICRFSSDSGSAETVKRLNNKDGSGIFFHITGECVTSKTHNYIDSILFDLKNDSRDHFFFDTGSNEDEFDKWMRVIVNYLEN